MVEFQKIVLNRELLFFSPVFARAMAGKQIVDKTFVQQRRRNKTCDGSRCENEPFRNEGLVFLT